jgi:hypothetical protein
MMAEVAKPRVATHDLGYKRKKVVRCADGADEEGYNGRRRASRLMKERPCID